MIEFGVMDDIKRRYGGDIYDKTPELAAMCVLIEEVRELHKTIKLKSKKEKRMTKFRTAITAVLMILAIALMMAWMGSKRTPIIEAQRVEVVE